MDVTETEINELRRLRALWFMQASIGREQWEARKSAADAYAQALMDKYGMSEKTAYRHRAAILGLVGGRCEVTGSVHFPPSRISYDQGKPLQDTQRPYKLAERRGTVLSWSAEYLSFHRSPPHRYGQVDFDGGGRILMEFTDTGEGDVDTGTAVEMSFRIKDVDDRRGYTRYFWKATPVRASASNDNGTE